MNELLLDVHVCEIGTLSLSTKVPIRYVVRSVLQIESELACGESGNEIKASVVDFNKLVAGSASHKVFIGGHMGDTTRLRGDLYPIASSCPGSVTAFFVPHPRSWSDLSSGSDPVHGYAAGPDTWNALPLEVSQ